MLRLENGIVAAVEDAVDMLSTQGRMKYVRPLFQKLLREATTRDRAIELATRLSPSYHPICGKMVAKDVTAETSKPAECATDRSEVGASPASISVPSSSSSVADVPADVLTPATSSGSRDDADTLASPGQRGPSLSRALTQGARSSRAEAMAKSRTAMNAELQVDGAKLAKAAQRFKDGEEALDPEDEAAVDALTEKFKAATKGPRTASDDKEEDGSAALTWWGRLMAKRIDGPTADRVATIAAGAVIVAGILGIVIAIRRSA